MNRVVDYGERLFMFLLAVPWLWAFSKAAPSHPRVILLMISEMMTVFIILCRKPGEIALTPYAIIIGFLGTAFPLLARPIGAINPNSLSAAIMLVGVALSLSGKIALNRRFGLVAANRGIQVRGPYALVRHPIYAGYLMTQVGFLIGNPALWNIAAYSLAFGFQILRIFEEEKLLSRDAAYRAFADKVRYRLIPGVF